MSATKRAIEDKVEELADKYGYSWDLVMDAINFAEYDWDRVEHMCQARVLKIWVNWMTEKEEAYEKARENGYCENYRAF